MLFTIQKVTPYYVNLHLIHNLYQTAFPVDERCPFDYLLEKTSSNSIQFLAFYHQQDFVGFTYLVTSSSLIYIFYLAIDEKQRNKGYGGKIVEYIQCLFPQHCLFLDIEIINPNADNAVQRRKRKDFYCKHHFQSSGYFYHFYHVDYEVLTYGQPFIPSQGEKLFYDFSQGHVNIRFHKESKSDQDI